jgi:molybdate transport system substrate-binding protein
VRDVEEHMKRTMVAAFAAALAMTTPALAVQVKVLVGGAMTQPMRAMAADFTKKTGNTLDFVSDTTGGVAKRLHSGEKADIIVVSGPGMDALEKEHLLQSGSRIDLSRALIGVGVKAGSNTMPDLSSADAFKATLLKVRSIAYVSPQAGGTSGVHFDGLLKKMGIADQMKAKTVFVTQGSEVAQAVADGKAEIGITFTSEMIPNKGVKVAGTLPAALNLPTNYVAAISSTSANAEAARAFIQAMRTPEGGKAIRDGGMEPLNALR